ncbi:MAG: archease [Acidobacteria bacterium]|nr:archease [Acidobacteriota bacterium]
MKKFEELEHTADLGLRIFGRSENELLENAAEGMFSLIGQARFDAADLRELRIEIPGAPPASAGAGQPAVPTDRLLYQWLTRLLQEFNLTGFFPARLQVAAVSGGYAATLWGGTFDPALHSFNTEIKGVTWHGLKVARIDSEWQAEVIFDV